MTINLEKAATSMIAHFSAVNFGLTLPSSNEVASAGPLIGRDISRDRKRASRKSGRTHGVTLDLNAFQKRPSEKTMKDGSQVSLSDLGYNAFSV